MGEVDPPQLPPLPPGPAPQRLPDVDRATVIRIWGDPEKEEEKAHPDSNSGHGSLAETLKNDTEFLKLSKADRIRRYQELLNTPVNDKINEQATLIEHTGNEIKESADTRNFKRPNKHDIKQFKKRKRERLVKKLHNDLK